VDTNAEEDKKIQTQRGSEEIQGGLPENPTSRVASNPRRNAGGRAWRQRKVSG